MVLGNNRYPALRGRYSSHSKGTSTHKVDILEIAEIKIDKRYTLLYSGAPQGILAKEGVGVI